MNMSPIPEDPNVARAARLDTATLSDALDKLGIIGQCYKIKPRDPGFRLAGRAWTLKYGPAAQPCGTVGDYIDDVAPGSVIVLDNNGCQCIHNLQRGQGIPSFANEYRYRDEKTGRLTGEYLPIDFAMVARGYGGNGYTATNPEELAEGVKAMQASNKSTLIDIKTVPGTMTDGYDAWWRVGVAQQSRHKAVEEAAADVAKHVEQARKF